MPAQTHPHFYWLSLAVTAVVVGWWAWRYLRAVRARPRFDAADVVFQEWFASGCSQKNIITKLGGARNCLRLVVTLTPRFSSMRRRDGLVNSTSAVAW